MHVNGQRSKPSKRYLLRPNRVIIRQFSEDRCSKADLQSKEGAKLACELFEETQESIDARHEARELREFNRISKSVVRPQKSNADK